jgi:hypothetical protein
MAMVGRMVHAPEKAARRVRRGMDEVKGGGSGGDVCGGGVEGERTDHMVVCQVLLLLLTANTRGGRISGNGRLVSIGIGIIRGNVSYCCPPPGSRVI